MKNPNDNENAYVIIHDSGEKIYVRIVYGTGEAIYGFQWYESSPFSVVRGGGYDKCGAILDDWLSQHDVTNTNVDSHGLFGTRFGQYRIFSLNSFILESVHFSDVEKVEG